MIRVFQIGTIQTKQDKMNGGNGKVRDRKPEICPTLNCQTAYFYILAVYVKT